ncbi:MAG: NAD-dependent epimerase/dehydratase family protein [Pseudonocardiaceae bacterium]
MPTTPNPLPDPTLGAGEGLALNGAHAAGEGSAELGAVVVTGVCGFIGSHLALGLRRRGATVIRVDRQPLTVADRSAGQLRSLQDQPGYRMLTASVGDPEVARCLSGASAVVHLAAATDVAASWGAGFTDHAASVLSTQRLLDACGREGVPRVVMASSAHVYGAVGGGVAREDLAVEPASPYGVAKLAAERLAVAYGRRPGSQMSTVALRLFTAFGPGCHPAMVVPRLFTAAVTREPMPLYGDGSALHTWTYVSDLVEATIRAVVLPMEAGDAVVVNVAGPDQASLLRVADLVGAIVGRPVPLHAAGHRAGDAAGTRTDLTRARHLLGFTPRVGLNEGLLRQWRHMTADRNPDPTTGLDVATPGATARQ